MVDNSFSTSNSDQWLNSESMTSYDSDDDDNEGILQQNFEVMEITGITDVLPRVCSVQSDDSWAVESYANDSLPLAHFRIDHSHLGYNNQEEDDMSLGYGSASGGVQQQQQVRANWVVTDEDDWTIQSDCNDSVGLANTRMKHTETPPAPVQQQQPEPVEVKPVSPRPLVRIPRRRASMGDYVEQQQSSPAPAPTPAQQPPQQPSQPQQRRISDYRRKSLSSVESLSTVEESLSSGRSNNSNSNPASSPKKKTSKSGRTCISRSKSMPFVKPASLGNVVPLWPGGQSELPRRKMDRRVSNGGTPCAA